MTASMGISSYPRDSASGEGVITAALSALNKAKSDARGFHYYYSKELREQSERRQMILSQLYEAVERNEFRLMYSPPFTPIETLLFKLKGLLFLSLILFAKRVTSLRFTNNGILKNVLST